MSMSKGCTEVGLPAEGTVDIMRALVAKWVEETKYKKKSAVTQIHTEIHAHSKPGGTKT